MSESENALPLDNSFWEHCEHLNFTIGLPVSETRMMDILQVLKDIYFTIEEDALEAQKLIITMAAILVASKDGKADKIWEELSVQEAMKNVDSHIKDILNEG
jgi:hypothetical protein